MTRKEKELESRISYIVQVAENLFGEKGIENVTMEEISTSSEFSKPTLYKYFKSKDELALLVYKKIQIEKIPFLESKFKKPDSGREMLFKLAIGMRDFFVKNPVALKFQLQWDYQGLKTDRVRTEILDEVFEYASSDITFINEIVKKGISDGSFNKTINHKIIFDLFFLSIRSILNHNLFMNGSQKGARTTRQFDNPQYESYINIFLDGLKPDFTKTTLQN